MTTPAPARRSLLHRLTGLAAVLLFAIFMGGIVLAKAAMLGGFTAPRLPAQTEFLLLLASTFLAIVFLIREETRKNQQSRHAPDRASEFQPEEERQ
ncbi:MAG: hypothetical protein ACQEVT_00110 [Pseudomonadota bacterium]|uniref:hypothetical protein n=1 Tax=Roseovarius TaxID=74030 RepID=UPI0022A71E38|nr:hypothetical protein [Roseovarius sp. EGI FJ00037]MCZ0811641.1 hypothetical protein [Roseovarius sp. EGI FJ00037]